MNYRELGKTGLKVSEISLGTWQVGGKWGSTFSHDLADSILKKAVDSGINFFDTADVYGAGQSERAVGNLLKEISGTYYVATKCGRKLNPHTNLTYTPEALRGFVEDSLRNMRIEALHLIQLHCPPTEVYYRPEIFEEFEKLKKEGKILNLGVSVEKIEEGLKAMEFENVTSIQIIFNIFRQRPKKLFFEEAKKNNVGVIVRVPLASGLLSGKYDLTTIFDKGDHRNFNRDGKAFDKGETFSGVNYITGLAAVERLRNLFPDTDLAQLALRWILMFDAVSCIIPGASRVEQVSSNTESASMPPLKAEEMAAIEAVYDELIKPEVHQLW